MRTISASVTVDSAEFLAGMAKFPQEMLSELEPELKQQLTDLQLDARKRHRFKTRTGFLEKSVQTDIEASGIAGHVYLDTGIAAYGPYVHEGQRSWKPDRFIDEAATRREKLIVAGLDAAVKRAIRKVGLE